MIPCLDHSECEQRYQNVYKPLISSLYTLPKLPFTLSMSGTFIEWIDRNHPEFFMILNEMISRKQIDILGGGYYSPLFPLIPPVDRVGQTELLTTAIRKFFGKRPRGAWLPASAWDPSMISSLTSCGIEYVLLDRLLLETSGFAGVDGYSPATLEDGGKTVTALPLDNRYNLLERFSPESFLDEMKSVAGNGPDRVLAVFIDEASIPSLFRSGREGGSWFEEFLDLVSGEPAAIELSNTGRTTKNRTLFKRTYVGAGMSPFDIEDSIPVDDIRILSRTSAKRYLINSPDIMNMYSKMMYVHTLVNQLRGDKSRKNNAREELWMAQNSELFLPRGRADRNRFMALCMFAYKNLIVAEKTSRLRGVFASSINSFDFDMDGLKEYLCQLESLNIYVHASGGKIFELDVLETNRNYCDTGNENSGFFIDHFIDPEEVERLARTGELAAAPVFADTLYQETSLDASRQEIQLKATGNFGVLQQPLSLRKQYNFRNEGIQVQYILKNESPLNLSGIFMIEVSPSLAKIRGKAPVMSVYANDNRRDSEIEPGRYEDVAWVQMTDTYSGARFTLEPNENASFITTNNAAKGSRSARFFIFWKVDLGPGYETEKTVFLKIDA